MWIYNFSLILTFYPAVNPGIRVKGLTKHKNNTIFRLSIKVALKAILHPLEIFQKGNFGVFYSLDNIPKDLMLFFINIPLPFIHFIF